MHYISGGSRMPAKGGIAHRMTPVHTSGLDCSNSTFHPYKVVPAAMRTLDQPNASFTSVWVWFSTNKPGRDSI